MTKFLLTLFKLCWILPFYIGIDILKRNIQYVVRLIIQGMTTPNESENKH